MEDDATLLVLTDICARNGICVSPELCCFNVRSRSLHLSTQMAVVVYNFYLLVLPTWWQRPFLCALFYMDHVSVLHGLQAYCHGTNYKIRDGGWKL